MKKRLILATALFSLGLVACQQHNPANTLVSTTPNDYSTPALTEQNKTSDYTGFFLQTNSSFSWIGSPKTFL
ncbi:hypothetical protein N5I08_13920 [Acinetobacter johnsonii]|uniref:hypothetical protein n=1 Tax=Acinetobacter johnsonii TaxID=40214 RepID=UPI00244C823C|nr:hypothetical protein [Acinetobacter johnsonii]MDH1520093.1 hypothetical protein [Acinetobacter johnsonii]